MILGNSFLFLLLFVSKTSAISLQSVVSVSANISGTFRIGGLFPVRMQAARFPPCGPLQITGVLQVETFLYAISYFNQHFLTNFTLGAYALDTCDDKTVGLRQGLKFIQNVDSGLCFDDQEESSERSEAIVERSNETVYGIVGPAASDVSIQVATLLDLFCMPVISYESTSDELSNVNQYPYFLRTVPSDAHQARGLINLLILYNWTYVSIVYEDSEYGLPLYDNVTYAATESAIPICFDTTILISTKEEDTNYAHKAHLLANSKAPVVLLLLNYLEATGFFAALKNEMKPSQHFQWVGVDGWSLRDDVTTGVESLLEGAFAFQPYTFTVPALDEHLSHLSLQNLSSYNPWLGPFLEQESNCCYPPLHYMNGGCENGTRKCNGTEKLQLDDFTLGKLHYVYDAVYAYAYAFYLLFNDLCDGVSTTTMKGHTMSNSSAPSSIPATAPVHLYNADFFENFGGSFAPLPAPATDSPPTEPPTVCPQLQQIPGSLLLEYILKVPQQFAQNFMKRQGVPFYSIYQYKSISRNATSQYYDWVNIGFYNELTANQSHKGFYINNENVDTRFMLAITDNIKHCFATCAPNQKRAFGSDVACCWQCEECNELDIVTGDNMDECQACPLAYKPNVERRNCTKVEPIYIRYTAAGILLCLLLSAIGFLLTLGTAVTFYFKFDTPIVKASGRELSIVLLICIAATFLLPFLYLSRPSEGTCGFSWFLNTFLLTSCVSTVLVKTNRITRIFNRAPREKRIKYIKWRSQILFVAILVSIEVIINTMWLVAQRPTVVLTRFDSDTVIQCSPARSVQTAMSLLYPMALLIFTVVYAYMARKAPYGYNEARYIMFCVSTILAVNIVLIPVYFANDYYLAKEMTLFFNINLTGYTYLACMFVPKLYIVLRSPEKNTAQRVMSRHSDGSVITDPNQICFTAPYGTRDCGVQTDDDKFKNTTVPRLRQNSIPEKKEPLRQIRYIEYNI